VQVYMGVTVLTESRRRTCKSSGAQRTWRPAGRGRRCHVSSGGGRVWSTLLASEFSGLDLKTIGDRFMGLGLKTRTEVPRRNGRHMVVSGSSCRDEATDEEVWWPSDEDDNGLYHNALGLSGLTQLYPGIKLELCNSPVK
jgi:hypothetical protein